MPLDGVLTRGTGRASTLDRTARTVQAIALSGLAPAIRTPPRDPAPDGSPGPWIEELAVSGADLASLTGAPVLLDHVATVRSAVGTVEAPRVEGDRIVCTVRFDGSPEADAIMAKIEAGSVRGVSLGYRVTRWQRAGTAPNGLPVFRAVAWKPAELSLCPLPVDPGALLRSSVMPDIAPPAADTAAPPADPALNRAALNRTIRSIAATAGLDQAWIDSQIDAGADADAARRAAFEAMAKRSAPALDNRTPRATITHSYDNPMVMRRAMADALAHRLAPAHCRLEGPAERFRSHGPLAMLAQLLTARGERIDVWDRDAILQRAIGAHSTSDFPLLLADAANKSLLAQYQSAQSTYRQIAAPRNFNDFKPHRFLRLGDFPTFKKLAAEGAPVQFGTISENRETVTADEFATGIIIGRKALINDDLEALADFSSLIAIRSALFENASVYALLASDGPNLSDGNPLFHSSHGNKAGSGTTIANGIDGAVQAVRVQTGLDGAKLNLRPRFLVVGPAQEAAGRRILAQINPTQASNVNPWAGQFELVVDNEISGNRWFMAADPAQVPSLVYGYVNGATGPQIKTETDFDTQAVKVRAGLDFAAGVIDFRGLYLNTGA